MSTSTTALQSHFHYSCHCPIIIIIPFSEDTNHHSAHLFSFAQHYPLCALLSPRLAAMLSATDGQTRLKRVIIPRKWLSVTQSSWLQCNFQRKGIRFQWQSLCSDLLCGCHTSCQLTQAILAKERSDEECKEILSLERLEEAGHCVQISAWTGQWESHLWRSSFSLRDCMALRDVSSEVELGGN